MACGCEPFTRHLLPRRSVHLLPWRSVRIARSTKCRNIGFERSVATSSIRGCWRCPFGGEYLTGPGRLAGSGGSVDFRLACLFIIKPTSRGLHGCPGNIVRKEPQARTAFSNLIAKQAISLGPHAEEPREARRLEAWAAIEIVAILRDGASRLLRMRLEWWQAENASGVPLGAAPSAASW